MLFSTLFMLFQFVFSSEASKVDIVVYYSSHCWYSRMFISNQLMPTYKEMSQIMNVTLIPYGKAKFTEDKNGTIEFDCRFGSRECKAMFMQVCALHMYQMSKVLPFIACMESSSSPEKESEKCALKTNLDLEQLNSCSVSKQAQKYLKENGLKTAQLNPSLEYVPWILFNGVYSRPMQLQAREDLKLLVCKLYNEMDGPKTAVAGCEITHEVFQ